MIAGLHEYEPVYVMQYTSVSLSPSGSVREEKGSAQALPPKKTKTSLSKSD